jgi:hypothetical protein
VNLRRLSRGGGLETYIGGHNTKGMEQEELAYRQVHATLKLLLRGSWLEHQTTSMSQIDITLQGPNVTSTIGHHHHFPKSDVDGV